MEFDSVDTSSTLVTAATTLIAHCEVIKDSLSKSLVEMFVDFDKFMGVYLKGRVGCAQRKQPR